MRMNRQIVLRISAGLVALILALSIVAAALVYSGPRNREAVSAVAREFFVQVWKGSQKRSATSIALPSATPEGRIIH
jgi:hypothetical protein